MRIRVIPTKMHGAIDYVTAPAVAAAPSALHLNGMRSSTLVPRAVGAAEGLYSALTDYELGVRRLIPMRAHLALDAAAGAAIAAAPWVFGSARHGTRHWLPHALVGAGELALAATTKLRQPSLAERAATTVRKTAGDALRSRKVLAGVAAVAVVGGLALLARRRMWQALAVVAEAVEEVADTVEDAAEDVRDAARARTEDGSAQT